MQNMKTMVKYKIISSDKLTLEQFLYAAKIMLVLGKSIPVLDGRLTFTLQNSPCDTKKGTRVKVELTIQNKGNTTHAVRYLPIDEFYYPFKKREHLSIYLGVDYKKQVFVKVFS